MRHHGSLLTRIMQSFAISPEQGAITQLFAASAPDAKLLSGKYLVPYAREGVPSAFARDDALAKKMWDWCEAELEAF